MRLSLIAITAASVMALAAPASAQLVNGLSGPNYMHDAPIGTKAGGAMSTLQAPGETAAITGAIQNEKVARGIQPMPTAVVVSSKPGKASFGKTSFGKRAALRPTRLNEHAMAKQRLDLHME